jgi:hypothetical protein
VRSEFPDQEGEGCGQNDRADDGDCNYQLVFHNGVGQAGFYMSVCRLLGNTRRAGGKFQEIELSRRVESWIAPRSFLTCP